MSAQPLEPGVLVKGRYLVENELGDVGFALTYTARDQQLHGRRVVIKLLLENGGAGSWFENKFAQELQAISRIDHPGVVAPLHQAALESSRLGHGYLTFALVEEGLKTPAADSAPADGQITAAEWFEYAARRVPEMQIEALEQARQQGRLLTFEPGATGAGQARLQTPRFFSKRDTSGPPLIMAKPEAA